MKKKISFVLSCLLLALPLSASALKLGYVDMKVLLSEAPQVQSINERMRDKFEKRRADVLKMGKDIQDKAGDIKRNELLMTESKLKASKKVLEDKYKDYKQKEEALAREMQQARSEELNNFRTTIRGILDKIAKKQGYDMILNDGVIYAKDKLNITQLILDDLKKQHDAEQKKASSKK